jgi:uncharacterized membrane protein
LSDTAVSREDAPRLEAAFAGIRSRLRLAEGEAAAARRVVYAATAAYAALFVSGTVLNYLVFKTAHVDLGNMVQAIWNTLHGHFLESTTLIGHQRIRFSSHIDPFLVLLAPLFWVWPSPLLLLVIQALAVSSGALPVFWLARKHLGSSRAGAHFALAYLTYPATQFNAFTLGSGFHSVSIALPLLLYAIWFLDENRLIAFSAVALLAFTTKEEIPLAVGCLGIWYAVKKGRRAFGFGVFAVGQGVTLFNFLWLLPHYSHGGAGAFADRYRAVGGTPRGMVHKLFSDPLAFVHDAATGHKAFYLVVLVVPFVGLWLLEPLLVLGAVPDLAINLLSSDGNQTSLQFMYTAGILPFLVAASIFGAARYRKRAVQLSLWVFLAAGCLALYSPIYYGAADIRAIGSPLVAAKSHALGLIPAGVPVSASNELGGHLAERRYSYIFPKVLRSHWIIVDAHDSTYVDASGYERVIRRYESDTDWRIVYSSHGVTVLHRRVKSAA